MGPIPERRNSAGKNRCSRAYPSPTRYSAGNWVSKNGLKDRLYRFDFIEKTGAGEGIRTLDPNLGKVVLYP